MPNNLATEVGSAELASRLRIALLRTARRLKRETDGEHSVSTISALASLKARGPLTLGELADVEGVSRPSVTVLAASLLEQGLIARDGDPKDARLVRVTVTAAGEAALRASRTRRNAYLTEWLARLGEADRQVLDEAATILQRLAEAGA